MNGSTDILGIGIWEWR